MGYDVTLVPGLVYERHRRGVAFLECSEDKRIDAKATFDDLKEKERQNLLSRFEYWQRGNICDNYFHGWPNNPHYKHCFVFKWKEAGTYHRLYGFLTNPRRRTDPSYQVCVLISHARKNKRETDPSELDWANELKGKPEVAEAIEKAFLESGEEKW